MLGKHGGYLLDTESGDKVPIHRKGNLYVKDLWVRDADFVRQG